MRHIECRQVIFIGRVLCRVKIIWDIQMMLHFGTRAKTIDRKGLAFASLQTIRVITCMGLSSKGINVTHRFPTTFKIMGRYRFTRDAHMVFRTRIIIMTPTCCGLLIKEQCISTCLFQCSRIGQYIFGTSSFTYQSTIFIRQHGMFYGGLRFIERSITKDMSTRIGM